MTTSVAEYGVLLAGNNTALIVTLVSIFIGSFVAGLAGFAFSATAGAILFHWIAPVEAVPLLLVCSITTQLFSVTTSVAHHAMARVPSLFGRWAHRHTGRSNTAGEL